MLNERISCNGLFGLSMIHDNSINKYGSLNILLDKVKNKTLLIDFINKKMIIGLKDLNKKYDFNGMFDYNSKLMRMDVWIKDKKTSEQHKMLVDTGTLYSQYKREGKIELEGINDKKSSGTLVMNNAKILPYELVGDKPIILGYNDLYKGYIFINYLNKKYLLNNKILYIYIYIYINMNTNNLIIIIILFFI